MNITSMTTAEIDAFAERAPWMALKCAAELLTPARLAACADAEPCAALRCAAELLTPAMLDLCANRAPFSALRYAAKLLTPERLAAASRSHQPPTVRPGGFRGATRNGGNT